MVIGDEGHSEEMISFRVGGKKLESYCNERNCIQHYHLFADNLNGLYSGSQELAKQGLAPKLNQVHMVLGEGNFVLLLTEGSLGDHPMSSYDLYRIQVSKIAEHWDTIEPIPPSSEWKNSNGKY
jgi:predicted SnoaL-like aldol condensation-catalyzing enzyme